MKNTVNYQNFVYDLCEWYRINQRTLPFRKTRDPYAIFVSELMLQQTQVDTMIDYYNRFMASFPTIEALANAPLESVLKAWEGLGYYRRAAYVHKTAQKIVSEYQGAFPNNYKDLLKLPGVGRYTAGAILSIAYMIPTPAIDGNVFRVITRLLMIDDDITTAKAYQKVEKELQLMLAYDNPSDFTQALMELGALVCLRQPKCQICPVKSHCFAYEHSCQLAFPNKPKAKTKNTESQIAFIYENNGMFLLSKRPQTGLLANMFEFPQFQTTSLTAAIQSFNKIYNTIIQDTVLLTEFKHLFTHKIWQIRVYKIKTEVPITDSLYRLNTLPYAMSKAHLKIKDLI